MRFSLAEMRRYAHGVLEVVERDDGFRFERVPEGLVRSSADQPAAVLRARCPSGVRLRFSSDTEIIGIGLRYYGAARPFYQGTLVVDAGEPEAFGPAEAQPRWEGEIFRAAQQRMRTFEIWLPHLCEAELSHVELSPGCRLTEAPALSCRWLVYGDSITQGMTVALPTNTWVALAARALDADLLSLGRGGGKAVKELAENVPDWDCDFISIAYGTNDFNQARPLSDFESNTCALVRALAQRHPGRPVLLISVIPWAGRTEPNSDGVTMQQYRDATEGVADGFENVVLLPGPELVADDPGMFCDNVHPNERGMRIYADNFVKRVRPHIVDVGPA